MDQAGRQLGQRLVNGTDSSRPAPSGTPGASAKPAGRAPSAMGHAGAPAPAPAAGRRHGSRRAPARAAPGGRHRQQHQQQAGAMDQAGGHGSRWPGKPARRDAPSPAQGGRQGKPFSRPIPAPPVGDSKHCPREKAGGKGQETRQKRVCMYEEISLFNKFSICPRYVPALSPLCPR